MSVDTIHVKYLHFGYLSTNRSNVEKLLSDVVRHFCVIAWNTAWNLENGSDTWGFVLSICSYITGFIDTKPGLGGSGDHRHCVCQRPSTTDISLGIRKKNVRKLVQKGLQTWRRALNKIVKHTKAEKKIGSTVSGWFGFKKNTVKGPLLHERRRCQSSENGFCGPHFFRSKRFSVGTSLCNVLIYMNFNVMSSHKTEN